MMGEGAVRRATVLPVAVLIIASAQLAAALPAPTTPKQSIPADAPSQVKQAIDQLYAEDSQAQSAALEKLEYEGPAASSAVPFLMSMLHKIRPGWFVFLADSADDRAGYRLLHTLASIGKAAVDPLVESLQDKNPLVRAGAADTLSLTRAPVPAAPLLSALRDPDARVREHATHALGTREEEGIVEALRAEARDQRV